MKFILHRLLFVLLAAACGYFAEAQDINRKNKIMDFKIEISKRYMGRIQNRVIISPDTVIVEENIAINPKNYRKEQRALTSEERDVLINTLAKFPLNNFKESYYNRKVKDGIQLQFHIEINNDKKDIFVSNYYIDELGKLVDTVVEILHEDYFLYRKEMEHIDL